MSNSLQTSAHRKFSLIRHVEETYKSELEPKPRAGARCVDTVRIMGDYFFLSSWAGGILQILQSDWFRERAVFSPSGPLTAGGFFRSDLLGFRKNKNVIHQPRSVRIGKNCALRIVDQDLGHSFS